MKKTQKRLVPLLRLGLEFVVLMSLDAAASVYLYQYAWVLREPGWLFFPSPTSLTFQDVPHHYWVVVFSLFFSFLLFGLYRVQNLSLFRLLSYVPLAALLQMAFLAQYYTLQVGNAEFFPRSVFAVFAILLTGATLSYRLAFWLVVKAFQRRQKPAEKEVDLKTQPRDEIDRWISQLETVVQEMGRLHPGLRRVRERLSKLDGVMTKLEDREIWALRKSFWKEKAVLANQLMSRRMQLGNQIYRVEVLREGDIRYLQALEQKLELQRIQASLGREFMDDTETESEETDVTQQTIHRLARLDSIREFFYKDIQGKGEMPRGFIMKMGWTLRSSISLRVLKLEHFLVYKARFPEEIVSNFMDILRSDPAKICIFLFVLSLGLVSLFMTLYLSMVAEVIGNFSYLFLVAALIMRLVVFFRERSTE